MYDSWGIEHERQSFFSEIWIIMFKCYIKESGGKLIWLMKYKKKYKHWESQNSKSKKAPKMAGLDLAMVLCLTH